MVLILPGYHQHHNEVPRCHVVSCNTPGLFSLGRNGVVLKETMDELQGHLGGEVFYDFGDMSCGELLIALLKALRPLSPGALFELRSLDPAAPVDIPAWCRLRGHTLLTRAGGPDKTYYLLTKGGTS